MNRKCTFLEEILKGQGIHDQIQKTNNERAGPSLGSFWDHFAHSWVTLRSFWVYEVYFEVTLVHSQKTIIFPTDFNDCIQLWCQLGTTLGALGGHFWHTRVTLGYFGANSGAYWGHFGHLRVTLGHHEVTLSHFRGHFGSSFDI